MNKEFPSGMNEKCVECPTAKLCLDIIEGSIDSEVAAGFATQLDLQDELPNALSAAHFRATEAHLESSGVYADSMQKIAESQRTSLVERTKLCNGPTKKVFGKIACSQDICEQAMMLPFMSGENPRYPAARAIQEASNKLLDE